VSYTDRPAPIDLDAIEAKVIRRRNAQARGEQGFGFDLDYPNVTTEEVLALTGSLREARTEVANWRKPYEVQPPAGTVTCMACGKHEHIGAIGEHVCPGARP
jgi:hypothetical protein